MSAPAAVAPLRNIVFIGHTNAGKSTLGTLILPEGMEGFKVGHFSISRTKDCTTKTFVHHGMRITVVVSDTIGIGDTSLDQPTVLKKIAKAVKDFPEGLHAIFFVFDGKFSDAERTAYLLITKVLFPGCEPQLYLIRNKFRFCQDPTMCQEDIAALCQDEGTKAIFSRTPADHIFHVDSNPLSKDLRDFTKNTLLTLIGKLEKTYSQPEYEEIYERIKDTTTEEEAGEIVESLSLARLDQMSGLEVLGLGLGRTLNDFKAVLEEKCTIM